jgi:hypothetical protein
MMKSTDNHSHRFLDVPVEDASVVGDELQLLQLILISVMNAAIQLKKASV